ncbi:MAG: LuxR C-terminal-related transcriptional regulator [Rhodocyclaceae bacterium]|nr:LuxR C-terminal-related transcriptional regulator [Rhodocyclaceae bacterium]
MFRPVRTRLLDELEDGFAERPKVLSIVAPMGYGKTVLMSELYAGIHKAGDACFWVGLDDRHISVDRVLGSIESAIAGPEADLHPTQALLRGDNPIESRVEELIEVISRLPGPCTIFIDNLNSCPDESLGTLLDALIFRTPLAVRFVWSSASTLSFNLGRAKLEGLIRHIGFGELKFNEGEASALLGTKLAGFVGASGIDTILRQTEGWPGAIRMAQIVLESSDQPLKALAAFSGSDEDISELLNRQVLKGFTPELREFLLSIAYLHTFSVDQCRFVTDNEAAEQHVDFLLRRNVFIIPLDRNRESYRLHGLFREYLLGEANRATPPERRRALLTRAAGWCEQNGQWRDAIEYALESGEISLASRILDRTATIFVRDRGDIQQFIHWIESVQAAKGRIGWEANFWYVWALIFHRRYAAGLQQHEKLVARQRANLGKADAPPDDLPQRIDLLRICIDLLTDRLADAYAGSESWLAAKRSSDPHNIGSVYSVQTLCLISFFKFTQARQSMRVGQQLLFELGGAVAIGWVYLINGLLLIYEGKYAHAYKELMAGLARIRGELGEDSILSDTLAITAAKCAVETGLVDEARRLLAQGLGSAHSHGLVATTACGFDAAIALWNGGEDEFISIGQLREIASSYPPRLGQMLSCYLVQRLLRLGRLDEALAEAERVGLDVAGSEAASVEIAETEELALPSYRDLYVATAIELHLARSRYRQVEALVADEIRRAQADGRIARLVELGLAKAAIAKHAGKSALAEQELMQAVSRAARQRILRPFVERADTVSSLVSDTKPSLWQFAQREEQEFFAEICRGLPISNRLLHDWSEMWVGDQSSLGALTKREVELLSLLDMGLSNQQIADYSNVSITTTKWHLQNLYRKLDVSNRSAALARARAAQLLPK